jgi:hypothetical protein
MKNSLSNTSDILSFLGNHFLQKKIPFFIKVKPKTQLKCFSPKIFSWKCLTLFFGITFSPLLKARAFWWKEWMQAPLLYKILNKKPKYVNTGLSPFIRGFRRRSEKLQMEIKVKLKLKQVSKSKKEKKANNKISKKSHSRLIKLLNLFALFCIFISNC